jgi:hypothetical protein
MVASKQRLFWGLKHKPAKCLPIGCQKAAKWLPNSCQQTEAVFGLETQTCQMLANRLPKRCQWVAKWLPVS